MASLASLRVSQYTVNFDLKPDAFPQWSRNIEDMVAAQPHGARLIAFLDHVLKRPRTIIFAPPKWAADEEWQLPAGPDPPESQDGGEDVASSVSGTSGRSFYEGGQGSCVVNQG